MYERQAVCSVPGASQGHGTRTGGPSRGRPEDATSPQGEEYENVDV